MTCERVELLLVCSGGGHLFQLHSLRPAWEGYTHAWVTEDTSDARSLLAGEDVVFAHGPTHRNLKNGVVRISLAWLRNIVLAWRLIGRRRPKVLFTTGASTAVPFAWAARLRGTHVVYVESITRVDRPSVSCRLIGPAAHRVYAQWPELVAVVPRARYVGSVLS